MNHTVTSTLLLAAVFLGTGTVAADDRPREERPQRSAEARGEADRPRDRRPDLIRRLFEGIELSEAQRPAVQEIMHGFREEVETWRSDNREALDEIQERILEARRVGDREAALSAFDDLLTLTETRPRPDAAFELIREELTPEQTERFDANVEELRDRVQRRFEREGVGGAAARERRERGDGERERPGRREREE